MKSTSWLRAACGALLLGIAGSAVASTTVPEASIPFANHGGIYNWKADRDQGLWIQDVHRNWYYAKFMTRCTGLNFANSIGFDTRPMGSFDRFSSVIVPREGRCVVQSFTVSDGPHADKEAAKAS